MRIYYIAQGNLLNALWWPECKEVQKGYMYMYMYMYGVYIYVWGICICMTDSFCYTVEMNTALSSNYTLIKINQKYIVS